MKLDALWRAARIFSTEDTILSTAKLILMTYLAGKRLGSSFVESSCISSKPVLQLRYRPWLREHSGKGMLTNGLQLRWFGLSRDSMTTINLERFNFFCISCRPVQVEQGIEYPSDRFYPIAYRLITRCSRWFFSVSPFCISHISYLQPIVVINLWGNSALGWNIILRDCC